MANPIYVIGAGRTDFKRNFQKEGKSIRDCFQLLRSGTLSSYERALKSEDAKEGVKAFAEKRKAQFKGR